MESPDHVILGAGVVGLTTALELKDRYPECKITIIAKYLPGDRSIDYASPWAGANWQSMATDNGPQEMRDQVTYHKFTALMKYHPTCGIQQMECRVLYDAPPEDTDILSEGTRKVWFDELVGGLRYLEGEDLKGAVFGFDFNSFTIDVPVYLGWLYGEVLKRGVTIHRSTIVDINEVFEMYPAAKTVFNCTGLGSYSLKGVEDKSMYPNRGQVLLVETPKTRLRRQYVRSPARSSKEATYIFPRNPGGGIILGGCRQIGVWNEKVDLKLAEEIKIRCCRLAPELGKPEDLKVLMHGVGLRPSRKGGARVEKEVINGRTVVHNYGVGGAGYQASWGLAKDAVDLIGNQSRL